MFERYTDAARRAVFYARYKAQEFGGAEIDSHHLMLGIVMAAQNAGRLADKLPPGTLEDLEREFDDLKTAARTATAVDIPLSYRTKRALDFATERKPLHIDVAHLLAGVIMVDLRVAEALRRRGIDLQYCYEQAGQGPEPLRARIDMFLDRLPADRLSAAARVVEALRHTPVRVSVETPAGSFEVAFPEPRKPPTA